MQVLLHPDSGEGSAKRKGIAAAAGTWNGMFHGEAGQIDHDSDGATPAINTALGAVTGEFNANFTDGTVAGGFGAEEDW